MNRAIWDAGWVTRWLCPAHPHLGFASDLLPESEAVIRAPVIAGGCRYYAEFLESIDVLLFVENPFLQQADLVGDARRRGITVACIPMMEWLPPVHSAPWVAEVQVMFAPTRWSGEELEVYAAAAREAGTPCAWEERICGGRWGVSLDAFPYRERKKCERFIFCNGGGGVAGRKGAHVVAEAARHAPGCPVIVWSQVPDLPSMPSNCRIMPLSAPTQAEMYDAGDILLAPSKWEGLGLQALEAMASGVPVVTTDGEPMRSAGPVRKINATASFTSLAGRNSPCYSADPLHLAWHMRDLLGKDISKGSRMSREHIETNHNIADVLAELHSELTATF